MNQNDWLIIGGLGLLYFLTRSSTVYPQTYPAQPGSTPFGPPRPTAGGGGGSIGGGSSGGGSPSGGGPSTGGVVRNSNLSNPNADGTFTCADGSIVSDPAYCPVTYTCPDGTIATDPSQCPQQYQCPDGTNVSDASQCPDLQSGGTIPVDTMDPCDPNSSAYDPSMCASSGA